MVSPFDNERVATFLRQLGCTKTEVAIYLLSLAIGPAPVQELARRLKMNRVTVHSAVGQLTDKGLMYESRRGKRRILGAEEPAALLTILQKRQNELDILRSTAEYVAKLLVQMRRSNQSVPAVRFYEGVDGFKKMLEETLNAKDEVLVFTYVDIFAKLLTPKYLEQYYARRARKGIRTRLIFPSSEFGKRVAGYAPKFHMDVRFLSKDLSWQSGIFSWNNIIAIQSFTEGKVTCTIIENDDIAYFYRKVVYELCWQQAKSNGGGAS